MVSELFSLFETPLAPEKYMIVGWNQWADAGAISSGLPEYLIERTGARKVGEIKPDGFYLFQFPGMHHYLRPEIELEDGYPISLSTPRNELYYTGNDQRGLFIFLGEEPHLNAGGYATAFFEMVQAIDVKRVVGVGGVYGAMPYDRDREISCAYSLRRMKDELNNYAVRFSNYRGGTTIGSYLLKHASVRDIEFLVFYAFVPAYDLSQLSGLLQGIRIENDYKAWLDLMRRLNYMFNLEIELSDLVRRSEELMLSMTHKVAELDERLPQARVRVYLQELADNFTEHSFSPLDDVWERELGNLLDDL